MAKKSKLEQELTPFAIDVIKSVTGESSLAKTDKKNSSLPFYLDEPAKESLVPQINSLAKSILNVLDGEDSSLERLAFTANPTEGTEFGEIFQAKHRLIPDPILKRIAIQDSLIAAIANARSAHLAQFGRPQPNRFSTGFKIVPDHRVMSRLSNEQKEKFEERITEATKRIATCGSMEGWDDTDKMEFSQFLSMSVRNAIIVGRVATEVVYAYENGEKKFHSFRPIDAGTIYRASAQKGRLETVREQAMHMLERVTNKKLVPEKFNNDEYEWVQVIEGRPEQVFTAQECLVKNFYPVTDWELNGYPVTPIDTCMNEVMTHLNITTHNKLFFTNGRASPGMLVFKSDDVDRNSTQRIKAHFNASINSVGNSWRMPVFAIKPDDDIKFEAIDASERDGQFEYLSEQNARVILSAFQMSPEELPGYAHLSRGSNTQTMSESNNEYKLNAARDVGIRPLISQFEDFINLRILPLLDPVLAKFCTFQFVGLDAESPESESARLVNEASLHMSINDILHKVEKRPIPKEMAGDIVLNPQYQQAMFALFTVGEILEHFCGREGASKDPELNYRRDPFWMQLQIQKMAMAANSGQPQPASPSQANTHAAALGQSIDQVLHQISKSEIDTSSTRRNLLHHQEKIIETFMDKWQEEAQKSFDDILTVAKIHAPKPKK